MTSTHAKVDQGEPQPPAAPVGGYVVTWAINAETATSPREAALYAKGILEGIHDPEYIGNYFTVTDAEGRSTGIDLDEEGVDSGEDEDDGLSEQARWLNSAAADAEGDIDLDEEGVDSGEDEDDGLSEQARWLNSADAEQIRSNYTGDDDASDEATALTEAGVTLEDIETARAEFHRTIEAAVDRMQCMSDDARWSLMDNTVIDICEHAIRLANARRGADGAGDLP